MKKRSVFNFPSKSEFSGQPNEFLCSRFGMLFTKSDSSSVSSRAVFTERTRRPAGIKRCASDIFQCFIPLHAVITPSAYTSRAMFPVSAYLNTTEPSRVARDFYSLAVLSNYPVKTCTRVNVRNLPAGTRRAPRPLSSARNEFRVSLKSVAASAATWFFIYRDSESVIYTTKIQFGGGTAINKGRPGRVRGVRNVGVKWESMNRFMERGCHFYFRVTGKRSLQHSLRRLLM